MVTQPPPGNEVMPKATSSAEISVVTSRGFPSDAGTLAGLFKYFAGGADNAIDVVKDAQTTPGTFMPGCGFRVSIVLHGDGCKNALGWYNATEPATVPTAIYPIVPANLLSPSPSGIGCTDNDFCPLATRSTSQAGQHAWADPLPEFDPGIPTSPNWAGGSVGLALIGAAGTQCSETKYSQAELNDKSPSGAPWVTALVYHSIVDARAYYLAFESLPMCATSWKGCNGISENDGDFNDAVLYVRSLACTPDGGTPADGSVDAAPDAAGVGGSAGGVGGTAGGGGAVGSAGRGGASGAGGAGGGGSVAGASGGSGTNGAGGLVGAGGEGGGSAGSSSGGIAGTGSGGLAGASGSGGTSGSAGASGSDGRAGSGGAAGGAGGTTAAAGHDGAVGGGGAKSGGGCGCQAGNGRGGAGVLLWLALVLARSRRRR